jgi:hypothetical protein
MSIDTLAYSKTLEGAGLDRKAAEAHAEALTQHILPDLVTKTDLAAAKSDIEQAIEKLGVRLDQTADRLENKINLEIERAEHRTTLRLIGVVAAFDAALFALLRFVH